MGHGKFAKYKYAKEPAIRDMLVRGRIATLEKYLRIVDVRLACCESEEEKTKLLQKRQEAETMLARAKKLENSPGSSV